MSPGFDVLCPGLTVGSWGLGLPQDGGEEKEGKKEGRGRVREKEGKEQNKKEVLPMTVKGTLAAIMANALRDSTN